MDYAGIGNFIVALIPVAVGAMLFMYNAWQAIKIKTELIEKLQDAANKGNSFAVRHIFSIVYEQHLGYADILTLMHDERSAQITAALDSSPQRLHYENGRLGYTGIFQNRWIRTGYSWLLRVATAFFFLGFACALITTFIIQKNLSVPNLVGLVVTLVAGLSFANKLKQDASVRTLLNNQESLTLTPIAAAPAAPPAATSTASA